MAKFIVQLRRGTKEEWATVGKDIIPLEGELVLEYDNGVPRLKIGNGTDLYGNLPYMSVDSFVLSTHAYVTLYAENWVQSKDSEGQLINQYSQVVKNDTINRITNATITSKSKIDLQPSPEQLVIFHEKDLAFVTENDEGVVTVFCIGQKPTQNYDIQATITEVDI